jgi:DNA adenine methylase
VSKISAPKKESPPAHPSRVVDSASGNGLNESTDAKPFLRWAGGKRYLLNRLLEYCPQKVEGTYYEPFLGAGSLFFALKPGEAMLADANQHLIHCYRTVRDEWELVARCLSELTRQINKDHYYNIRDMYNRGSRSAAQAARFIFLNKTCFNGIFRVNEQGSFNVPYGKKRRPAIPSASELRRVSEILHGATIQSWAFVATLRHPKKGDFIYLDPPYPALNGTSYFAHYTSSRFSNDDQEALAGTVRKLDAKGCLVMMSNADIPAIRKLYRGFSISPIPATRFITCKKKKRVVRELVITNYDVKGTNGGPS